MKKKQHDCGCCGQSGAGLSRRDALTRLGYTALGAAGLTALAGCPGGSTYGRETASAGGDAAGESADKGYFEFDKRRCRVGSPVELELDGVKIIVARNKNTTNIPSWVAVDKRCTHNRCNVAYDTETNEFVCPCHGSRFNFAGEPLSGPARKPLATYRIEEGPVNVTIYNELVPAIETGGHTADEQIDEPVKEYPRVVYP